MKNKKWFLIVCLLVVAAFTLSLAACTNNGGHDTSNSESTKHTHDWTVWEIEELPTETTEGKMKRSCECGEVEIFVLPIISEKDYIITKEKEETCIEEGKNILKLIDDNIECEFTVNVPIKEHDMEYQYDLMNHWKECSFCHKKIDIIKHDFGEWIVDTEPTCIEDGSKHRDCVCGYKEIEKIAMTGHSFGEVIYNFSADGSSCIATRKCLNCGEEETIIANVTSEVSEAPTCTKKGKTLYTATFSETWASSQTLLVEDIPTIEHILENKYDENNHWEECSSCKNKFNVGSHNFSEWVIDANPTYTMVGSKHRDCACGYREQITIPVLDAKIIEAQGFLIDEQNNKLEARITNATKSIDFNKIVKVSENCTWKLYKDFNGFEEYPLKRAEIKEGANVLYLAVFTPDQSVINNYEVLVYRNTLIDYKFINDEEIMASGKIEETALIPEPPLLIKEGYVFAGWYVNEVKVSFPYQVIGQVVFEAKWTAKDYKIIYDLNGGENNIDNPETYTIEDTVVLQNPTKKHYEFIKWQINGVDTNTIILGSTEEKTATAIFKPTNYTITYKNTFGENKNPLEYNIETPTIVLADLERRGYTFDGWFNNGNKVTDITIGTFGDLILEAKWTAIEYKIKYELNGGINNLSNPEKYTIEDTIILENPTKDHYNFVKWQIDGKETNTISNGNIGEKVAKAIFKPIKYKITYELNEGINNLSNPVTYTIEDTIILKDPTKEHYDFVKWQIDGEDTNTITLGSVGEKIATAIFKPTNYTITYVLNGGVNSKENPDVYTIEDTIVLRDPNNKAGYTFNEWQIDGKVVNGIEKGTSGNKNIVAIWQPKENKLHFNGNGSTSGVMTDCIVKTDETIILNANLFVRDGYTFIGWATTNNGDVQYLDQSEYTMGTNSDYTLYAKWEINKNKVIFNANSGSGNMDDMIVETGATVNLYKNLFTKEHYDFMGWSTTQDNTVDYENEAEYIMGTNSSYILYAVWKATTYTISYHLGSGINNDQNIKKFTIESHKLPVKLADATSTTSDAFYGWYTDIECTNQVKEITEYKNYDIYAVYSNMTKGINFAFNKDSNTYSIHSAKILSDNLIILNTFNNFPISHIVPNVFSHFKFKNLLITLENAVIDTSAFNDCRVDMFSIGGNNITINDNAFSKCYFTSSTANLLNSKVSKLAFADVKEMNIVHCNSDIVDKLPKEIVQSLSIIDEITVIPESLCEGFINLKIFETRNQVQSVGINAFKGCSKVFIFLKQYAGDTSFNVEKRPIITNSMHIVEDLDYGEGIYYIDINNNAHFVTVFENLTLMDVIKDYNIDNTITYLNENGSYIEAPVTSICDKAFEHNLGVGGLSLPSNLIKIGNYAFYKCENLSKILAVNSKLIEIGDSAFEECRQLRQFDIPSTIEKIGDRAFFNNKTLEINLNDKFQLRYIGISSFENSIMKKVVNLGSNVTYICDNAFKGCTGIFELIIDDYAKVTSIGIGAFRDCRNMTYIRLPSNVRVIKSHAFLDCIRMSYARLPERLEIIEANAFAGCSLKEVNIPKNVHTVGNNAFENDSTTIYNFSNRVTLTNIKGRIKNKYELKYGDVTYTVKNGVGIITSVSSSIDQNCKFLSKINFVGKEYPVITIGSRAFSNCNGLREFSIPNGIVNIEEQAFMGCKNLRRLTIPNSVKNIAFRAFYQCNYIEEITVPFLGSRDVNFIELQAMLMSQNSLEFIKAEFGLGYIFGEDVMYIDKILSQNMPNLPTIYNVPSSLKKVVLTGGKYIMPLAFGDNRITEVTASISTWVISPDLKGLNSYGQMTVFMENTNYIEEQNKYPVTVLQSITNGIISATIKYNTMNSTLIQRSNGQYLAEANINEESKYVNADGIVYLTGRIGNLQIGPNVKEIYSDALVYSEINNIFVDGGNGYYYVEDNCLIEKATGNLLYVCKNSTFTFNGVIRADSLLLPIIQRDIGYMAKVDPVSLPQEVINGFVVSGNNEVYKAFEKCLIKEEDSKNSLIFAIGDIDIPKEVDVIESFAMYGNKSITIPNNVKEIKDYAFAMDQDLSFVKFMSVNSDIRIIGENVFYCCNKLKNVIFEGNTAISETTFAYTKDVIVFSEGTNGRFPEGWDKGNGATLIKYDYNNINEYIFNTGCEQQIAPIKEYGIVTLPKLTREGYVFIGWVIQGQTDNPEAKVYTMYFKYGQSRLDAKWMTEEQYYDGSSIDKARPINMNVRQLVDNQNLEYYNKFVAVETGEYIIKITTPINVSIENINIYDSKKDYISQIDTHMLHQQNLLPDAKEETIEVIVSLEKGQTYYIEYDFNTLASNKYILISKKDI